MRWILLVVSLVPGYLGLVTIRDSENVMQQIAGIGLLVCFCVLFSAFGIIIDLDPGED